MQAGPLSRLLLITLAIGGGLAGAGGADDKPVGRLYVDRREREIRILDITLLPEYRGAGLGTPLIQELLTEAEAAGKTLTIYVEFFGRSRRLFERLGFTPIEGDGYNALMAWRPKGTTRSLLPLPMTLTKPASRCSCSRRTPRNSAKRRPEA